MREFGAVMRTSHMFWKKNEGETVPETRSSRAATCDRPVAPVSASPRPVRTPQVGKATGVSGKKICYLFEELSGLLFQAWEKGEDEGFGGGAERLLKWEVEALVDAEHDRLREQGKQMNRGIWVDCRFG